MKPEEERSSESGPLFLPSKTKEGTMRFTKATVYALQALKLIDQNPEKTFRAIDIAQTLGTPVDFTALILSRLRRAQIVSMKRGPGGGFKTLKPLSEITLASVVQAVDRTKPSDEVVSAVAMNLKELASRALAQTVATVV